MKGGATPVKHTAKFDNINKYATDGPNGFGWQTPVIPSIERNNQYFQTTFTPTDTVHFNLTPDSQGIYHATDNFPDTMQIDPDTQDYIITRWDDKVWTLNGDSTLGVPQGKVKSIRDCAGNVTAFEYAGNNISKIAAYKTTVSEVENDSLSDSLQELSEMAYEYDAANHIVSVTIRELSNGALENVSRKVYAYYLAGENFGSEGDLKTVTDQVWVNGLWVDNGTQYYRYYTGSAACGKAHLLKMVFEPADTQALIHAYGQAGYQTADDVQAISFASFYYEYTPVRRVAKCASNRGRNVIQYQYTYYPESEDYNAPYMKTVEMNNQGLTTTLFTNFNEDVLLKEEVSPNACLDESNVIYYYQFNSNGKRTHSYSPKSVLGYTVVLGYPVTLNVSLSPDEGKVEISDYGDEIVSPKNKVTAEYVQQGSSGTPILLRQYAYEKRQLEARVKWNVVSVSEYPDESGTNPVTTQYSYIYYDNSLSTLQKTTTLPAVSQAHNGSGMNAFRYDRYDELGRIIWSKDELGIITYHQYDSVLDVEVKTIQDVDTSKTSDFTSPVPAGWTTVTGAGKHLITELEYDFQGRLVQSLGPKTISVSPDNQSVTTRQASWFVYDDANREVRSASGYATYNDCGFIFTLVNPVSITRRNAFGAVTDQIQARRISTDGQLLPTDTFIQADYLAWSVNVWDGGDLVSTRQYFDIPVSGQGEKNVNYYETSLLYDQFGRRNVTISPDGTITKTVFDWKDNPTQTWIGTSRENMVLVSETVYSGETGCPTCTGTTAQPRLSIQYADAETMRITEFGYDWRGRRIHTHYEEDAQGYSTYDLSTYDNLDRAIKSEKYLADDFDGRLLARTEQFYDERSQVWKAEQSIVNPETGTVEGKLQSLTWYDAAGRTVKSQAAGEVKQSRSAYDSLGRVTHTDVALPDGTVFQQSDYAYDAVGHAILTFSADRLLNQSGTGTLLIDAAPQGRFHFTASWHDGAGREIASADYGTNGNELLLRPETVPARSDTVLLTETFYDPANGRAYKTVDPAGKESRTFVDALGRTTKTVANYVTGVPSAATPDCDITVEYSYHASNQVETMTVVNPVTGNQVTRYLYGTEHTSIAPIIYRNDLLTVEIYPDSVEHPADGIADRVSYQYNRLAERVWKRDQNGTVHNYDYDNLGRMIHDRVTDVGTGVDTSVRRISTVYNINGQVESLASWDNSTVAEGSVINEVKYEYNQYGLLDKEYSNPTGAVTASSKYIGYSYDTTKSGEYFTKRLRPTGFAYPAGDTVSYSYGLNDFVDNYLNRPIMVQYNGATVGIYAYEGLATPVVIECPQASLSLDYTRSDALDNFKRITRQMWKGVYDINVVDIKHGYDRSGNRTYRLDEMASVYNKGLSEFYTYDGMNQLIDKYISPESIEHFNYDATGNHVQTMSGAEVETQSFNKANEIVAINGNANAVSNDRNGNMTHIPGYDLSYDAWNRLVRVSNSGSTIAEYQYNALNHRVVKTTPSETRYYFFDSSWQCVEEYADNAASPDIKYIWGLRYVDDMICRMRSSETLYPVADANWNVVALVNSNSVPVERYTYDAFGTLHVYDASFNERTVSLYRWIRTFTGQVYDTDTGLMLYRNRYYSSQLGRFITRDPIGYEGRDENLYCYVWNLSISNVDTDGFSGDCPKKQCRFIITPKTCQDFFPETVPGILSLPWRGIAIYADTPNDAVQEMKKHLTQDCEIISIQFWGHGSPGTMYLCTHPSVGSNGTVTIGDFTSSGPFAPLLPYISKDALIVFKGCNTFSKQQGHDFAEAAANFFNCRIGGHNAPIGYKLRYPGYHEISPGQKPHWPLLPEDTKKCKPKNNGSDACKAKKGSPPKVIK